MKTRLVQPEWLDALAPTDRQAIRSRADLRRLNLLMGSAGILDRGLGMAGWVAGTSGGPHLVDLGGGDGWLLGRVARRRHANGRPRLAILVDRAPAVDARTRAGFGAAGWELGVVKSEAADWLEQACERAAAVVTNLFLHHFPEEELRRLLALVARRTDRFVAVEPRRALGPWLASRCVGLMGANAVTRHDAVRSVRAGFRASELGALWPAGPWQLDERPAGLFSHCFVARRIS